MWIQRVSVGLRVQSRAGSYSAGSSPASSCSWSCVCAAAVAVIRLSPRTCCPTHCAVSSTSCTCRMSPQWSCMFLCCHPGTAAGCAGCGSCRWHTSSPGCCCGDPRASCHMRHRSSCEASELGDTRQRTRAPWWGWCWCSGHQRCT